MRGMARPNAGRPARHRVRPGVRVGAVGVGGAAVVVAATWVVPRPTVATLALVATAIVVGETLVIRVPDRPPLPLATAVIIGALRLPGAQLAAVVVAALAVHALCDDGPARDRAVRAARRAAATGAGWAAFAVVRGVAGTWPDDLAVLAALGAGGIVLIAVDERLRGGPAAWRLGAHDRAAELALLSSGLFLGFGYRGVGADTGIGAWVLPLFLVPLLSAWYAFERLATIRLTYGQTIAALSAVPELAGLARPGHAERVAGLCGALADELDLPRNRRRFLQAAALLHHLGHLCLPDPRESGRAALPAEVAAKGAEILRQTEPLRPAGDLLAPDTDDVAAQVLRVASAFDELTTGDPGLGPVAVKALRSGPGYLYDPAVLDALDRVVRRGELGRRGA